MTAEEKSETIKTILGNSAYCLVVLIDLVDTKHLDKRQIVRLNYVTKLVDDTIKEIQKIKDGE